MLFLKRNRKFLTSFVRKDLFQRPKHLFKAGTSGMTVLVNSAKYVTVLLAGSKIVGGGSKIFRKCLEPFFIFEKNTWIETDKLSVSSPFLRLFLESVRAACSRIQTAGVKGSPAAANSAWFFSLGPVKHEEKVNDLIIFLWVS